jgi:hypothetical protein
MSYLYFDEANYKFEMEAVQEAAQKLTRNFAKIVALDQPGLATRDFCIAATLDDGERPTAPFGWRPSNKLRNMVVDALGISRWPQDFINNTLTEIFGKLYFPEWIAPKDEYGFVVIEDEHRKLLLEKLTITPQQISRLIRDVVNDFDFADGVFTMGEKVRKRLKDRHSYRPKGKAAENAIALVLEIEKNFKKLAETLPGYNFNGRNGMIAWKEYLYRNGCTNDDGSLNEQHLWYWGNIESDVETKFKERQFI